MDISHLSLAELFDLKSAVNKAINHRISSAADDFIWQLCAHYGVELSQFKQASRRQYADIKRMLPSTWRRCSTTSVQSPANGLPSLIQFNQ